jgi:hypothetical protein
VEREDFKAVDTMINWIEIFIAFTGRLFAHSDCYGYQSSCQAPLHRMQGLVKRTTLPVENQQGQLQN